MENKSASRMRNNTVNANVPSRFTGNGFAIERCVEIEVTEKLNAMREVAEADFTGQDMMDLISIGKQYGLVRVLNLTLSSTRASEVHKQFAMSTLKLGLTGEPRACSLDTYARLLLPSDLYVGDDTACSKRYSLNLQGTDTKLIAGLLKAGGMKELTLSLAIVFKNPSYE